MPRIVPSLVRQIIETEYPWARESAAGADRFNEVLDSNQAPSVSMILGLAEQIPADLLPPNAADHAIFVAACGAMRGALVRWSGGGDSGLQGRLFPSAVFRGRSPVSALLDVLRRAPDEAASVGTSDLAFIPDESAREDIRVDVANAHRALGNGEYKASTVLAGSVIEALLLWRIKTSDGVLLERALERVDEKGALRRRPPEKWHLQDYVSVAHALDAIDKSTTTAATLAQEFRNLIHPGRVLRSGSRCDQATALSALGAMQQVIGALTRRAE